MQDFYFPNVKIVFPAVYIRDNVVIVTLTDEEISLSTHQVRLAVWEGDDAALLHEVVAEAARLVGGARPEGEGLGGVDVLTAPLQVTSHAHQAAALLRQLEQVQPEGVRGVEDVLDAAHQVVDVVEEGDLPPLRPAHHTEAGGQVGEGADSPPALRILPIHPHCDLDKHLFSCGFSLVKYSMHKLRFYCKINEYQVLGQHKLCSLQRILNIYFYQHHEWNSILRGKGSVLWSLALFEKHSLISFHQSKIISITALKVAVEWWVVLKEDVRQHVISSPATILRGTTSSCLVQRGNFTLHFY